MTFTQGGASLALGYFMTPLTGSVRKKAFILAPGSGLLTSCRNLRPGNLDGLALDGYAR